MTKKTKNDSSENHNPDAISTMERLADQLEQWSQLVQDRQNNESYQRVNVDSVCINGIHDEFSIYVMPWLELHLPESTKTINKI